MSNQKFKVLILGAGAGGISMAARLSKKLPSGSIAIVDSAKTHYYQPLWTLVGGGVVRKEETARPQSSLIPSGVEWVQQ
ncbi:MAG: NAD(P)/FAD-dependent oxidoreductase, partial [Bdellovibrionaceae bacterium]|nr:NAD(P)/FAD-dependent oxidoreductase [Pseudobdellovibrionaceae bacterium]